MIVNSYITNSFSDFSVIMRFMWKWIQRAQPAFRLLARTSQASLLSVLNRYRYQHMFDSNRMMFLLPQLKTSVPYKQRKPKSRQIVSLLGKNNVCSVYKSRQPYH